VHLDYTPEQKQLRAEIRASLEAVMTPERIAAVAGHMEGGEAVKECVRALGAADLLGVGPKSMEDRALQRLSNSSSSKRHSA
jgi:3-oxocholest-4-en-26-oyl-CoA dehydrogenase alpha subunit